jgi:hypothetical protein
VQAASQPAPAAACTFLRLIRALPLAAAAAGWFLQGDYVPCFSVAKTEANQKSCPVLSCCSDLGINALLGTLPAEWSAMNLEVL